MFAVIFEVNPRPEAWDEYLGHAASLRPELLAIDGFIANERYASLGRPGWLVSLSIWRDEKALIRWRTHALHHDIQGKGRASVFADYHLRVGEIVSDTGTTEPLPQNRFDTTEAGPNKAVTLTERPTDARAAAASPDCDAFDSITRPGNGLYIMSWPDLTSAEAGITGAPGRHRVVRIIRDYGMFARAEAPQYFPPTTVPPTNLPS
jgi:heme-degrading monooxygenase HmoA